MRTVFLSGVGSVDEPAKRLDHRLALPGAMGLALVRIVHDATESRVYQHPCHDRFTHLEPIGGPVRSNARARWRPLWGRSRLMRMPEAPPREGTVLTEGRMMSETNTMVRGMHDVGLAAWFGGSLMGAVGLNGAAEAEGESETKTARIASTGWAKWAPVNTAAIGMHLIGGTALLAANAARVRNQEGVAGSTLVKTVLTAAAMAASAYSRVLGQKILGKKIELATSPKPDDTEKAARHPIDLDKAQKQLAITQWVVPALTGAVVVLGAVHGEQQRPAEQSSGILRKAMSQMDMHH
jgi:hypothetical protein